MFVKKVIDKFYYYKLMPDVKVMPIIDTINLIKSKQLNVIRFGDGEFDIISGSGISYQKSNSILANELEKILLNPTITKNLICIPGVFDGMPEYSANPKNYWIDCLRIRHDLVKKIAKTNYIYGNAMISRPYMDFKDKTQAKIIFKNIRSIWENRDILIVEGEMTRSGVGNDLFRNAKTVSRLICPSHDAFSKKKEIENKIISHKKDRLILIMLGPTAKVIVNDLSHIDNQIIDLGHIDSEYEWYKHGFLQKHRLPNKETAEVESTEIHSVSDTSYYQQIVGMIR